MKIIDAHTGLVVKVGRPYAMPCPDRFSTPETSRSRMKGGVRDNFYIITKVYPGIFSASADVMFQRNGERSFVERAPLTVRWLHPGFPFQHIAFVPS